LQQYKRIFKIPKFNLYAGRDIFRYELIWDKISGRSKKKTIFKNSGIYNPQMLNYTKQNEYKFKPQFSKLPFKQLIIKWLISSYSNEKDMVLDNTMGSRNNLFRSKITER
jgi:DNA modification methylase